eukprot:181753-Pyramimonas_sp.AAC.3
MSHTRCDVTPTALRPVCVAVAWQRAFPPQWSSSRRLSRRYFASTSWRASDGSSRCTTIAAMPSLPTRWRVPPPALVAVLLPLVAVGQTKPAVCAVRLDTGMCDVRKES